MAERKYVVFKLGEEEYAVDIMKVKEVTEYKETVKLPQTPVFVQGIINLRGDITPIINLKKRFDLSESEMQASNRVIVMNLKDKLIGFMVDEASQVITMDDSEIESAPNFTSNIDKNFIEGIGKLGDRMIIMLDLLKVLDENEKKELLEM